MSISIKSTKAELVKYITEELGLEASTSQTKDDLLDILAEQGVELTGDYTEPKRKSGEPKSYTISIAREKGGVDPVPVAYNGKVIRIKRGHNVDISPEHYEVLKNATKVIYEMDGDNNLESYEVPAYPYSTISINT